MRTAPFGPTGQSVAVIGQGTWQMNPRNPAPAIAALRRGIDLGMTHIDTAELYTGAEEIVADAIAGQRDRVFLVGKVVPANAFRQGTIRACEKSLARLKTSYLDCYLLHWPGSHPLADTIGAFERLVQAGKIRSWGVSNFDTAQLEAALRASGPGRIACNQVLYHVQERAIEHDVIAWCEANQVAVTAYSPFGSGDFPAAGSAGGRVLGDIAQSHEATPRQVALAFLVRHTCVFAIPKAADAGHAADNAAACDLTLTQEDITRIEQAFPRGPKPHRLPMI
jgi:diketogulonate reductase-like aldo/keto reductase